MICEAGRTAFFGGKWAEPCEEEAENQISSPHEETIMLCDKHFQDVTALMDALGLSVNVTDVPMAAQITIDAPTGNAFRKDLIADDIFIVRDPTMAVPELMRCSKCHEFIVEGSRCTFIGEHYRHLVHASCAGLT